MTPNYTKHDTCVIVDNFVEMGDFSVFQKVKRKKTGKNPAKIEGKAKRTVLTEAF